MTRARISLLLPLLAIAACQTERKPLTGFDTQPPGSLLLKDDGTGGALAIWTIFALPAMPQQVFRVRLSGQDAVVTTSQEGFYDYFKLYLQNWTGALNQWLNGIPPATYVVEVVDGGGQIWGQSAPLAIPEGAGFLNPRDPPQQLPTVVFSHIDGQAASWTIDPMTQDADPATDEITVTNLLHEDVVVERCLIAGGSRTSCTPVGTVAPGGDLLTVETVASTMMADHRALFIHLASDSSQSYQRDLVVGSVPLGGCEIERIIVHGTHPSSIDRPDIVTQFAMSSCYGYSSSGF